MLIGGFQKLTLLDYPGKIASLVFTQGCALRCSYCHNPELIPIKKTSDINADFIIECLKSRQNIIEGVCISGGEPTLHPDLPDFIRRIKNLGILVKLDTNGVHPKMIASIIQEGLVDYFAMDIKAPWSKYEAIIKVENPVIAENCKKTLRIIQNSCVDHEFRTTVFPPVHTEDDFIEMAGYLRPAEKYFIQNIRYEKTLDPHIDTTKKFNVGEMVKKLRTIYPDIFIEKR